MDQVQLLRAHKQYKQIHMFWTVQPSVELATGQHLKFNSGRNSYSCSKNWYFVVICVHIFEDVKPKWGPWKSENLFVEGGGLAKGVGEESEAFPRFFNQQKN